MIHQQDQYYVVEHLGGETHLIIAGPFWEWAEASFAMHQYGFKTQRSSFLVMTAQAQIKFD